MAKVGFIKDFTDTMGLPVMNDELIEVCLRYYDRILSLQSHAAAPPPPEPGSLRCELSQLKQELNQEFSDLKDELSQLKRDLTL